MNDQGQTLTSAEVVIITSGKDLNQFSQTNKLPSMPVAGQTTTAPINPFAEKLKTTIGHEGYLTPVSNRTSQLTFGASFDRDISVNGDVSLNPHIDKINLEQLNEYLPHLVDSFSEINSAHWDFKRIYEINETNQQKIKDNLSLEDDIPYMMPRRLAKELRESLADDDILALDNGLYKVWLARNYPARRPNTIILDNALATMAA